MSHCTTTEGAGIASRSITATIAIAKATSFLMRIDCGRVLPVTDRRQSITIKNEVAGATTMPGAILLEKYTGSLMEFRLFTFNQIRQRTQLGCRPRLDQNAS